MFFLEWQSVGFGFFFFPSLFFKLVHLGELKRVYLWHLDLSSHRRQTDLFWLPLWTHLTGTLTFPRADEEEESKY